MWRIQLSPEEQVVGIEHAVEARGFGRLRHRDQLVDLDPGKALPELHARFEPSPGTLPRIVRTSR